jgi:uncharacterized LabA/DUF88 family protein
MTPILHALAAPTRNRDTEYMPHGFLFVDEANLYLAAKNEGWEIDWDRFLQHLSSTFNVGRAYLYEGMPTERSILAGVPHATGGDIARIKNEKTARFRELRAYGYTVRHKPVATINGSNKCNFDVELTIDAIDQVASYDVFVLASGDGDFIRLVKYVRGCGKKVHVIGPSKANRQLRMEARGNFHSIDGMRSHISKSRPGSRPGPFALP